MYVGNRGCTIASHSSSSTGVEYGPDVVRVSGTDAANRRLLPELRSRLVRYVPVPLRSGSQRSSRLPYDTARSLGYEKEHFPPAPRRPGPRAVLAGRRRRHQCGRGRDRTHHNKSLPPYLPDRTSIPPAPSTLRPGIPPRPTICREYSARPSRPPWRTKRSGVSAIGVRSTGSPIP